MSKAQIIVWSYVGGMVATLMAVEIYYDLWIPLAHTIGFIFGSIVTALLWVRR